MMPKNAVHIGSTLRFETPSSVSKCPGDCSFIITKIKVNKSRSFCSAPLDIVHYSDSCLRERQTDEFATCMAGLCKESMFESTLNQFFNK